MKPAAPEPAPEPTAAKEMDVLFPDVDVVVRDPDTGERVTLTVRELRFLEGLRLTAEVRPFIEAIADSIGESGHSSASGEGDIDDAAIAQALTEHAEAWLACCAQASDRDAAWLARLSDWDGDAVSGAMWQANRLFFLPPSPRGREAAAGKGRAVPLAEVLDALVRAGHGRGHRDVAERLTWRQIRRFWEVDATRRAGDVERFVAALIR